MNSDEYTHLMKKSSQIGKEMYELLIMLYPICRSITGDGVRKTLHILQEHIPLEIHEVPSGTKVFDWTIPKEWNIRDAYIIGPDGNKIVDFTNLNLHILNYSLPINKKISLDELKDHIFTLPEQPNAIPYRTSYYKEDWGFCMSHNEFIKLKNGEYTVFIDSDLKNGNLTYGELCIKGSSDYELLISCYICHPSLCNDNLSGMVLTTFLAKYLSKHHNKFSIRFLFIPETIGSITWLAKNEENCQKIKYGLVVTCVGDSGIFSYKKSRDGYNTIDRIVETVLKQSGQQYKIFDFFPYGSDERQFCSPGFNLPVGSLMRSMYIEFPQYHTSDDNLEFVKASNLAESFSMYLSIWKEIENNKNLNENKKNIGYTNDHNDLKYLNLFSKCEPHLSKYGLIDTVGGKKTLPDDKITILWVLNQSDGKHTLNEISQRSGIEYSKIKKVARLLEKKGLLKILN